MDQSGDITINNETIKYKMYPVGRYNFIVSYLSEYNDSVLIRLKEIVDFVIYQKRTNVIPYNTLGECDRVTSKILSSLHFTQNMNSIIMGMHVIKRKILLHEDQQCDNMDGITELYGYQQCIMGCVFHSISYVSFIICNYGEIHIAFDISSSSRVDKVCMSFFVAPSIEELEQVIKIRYQYKKIIVCNMFDSPYITINELK